MINFCFRYWIGWKFKYVITVSITKQVIEMSRGPTSSSKWLHKVEKIGTWMKKKVKKVNKRWRRWRGSAHGWAPVPGQPHMARNVLIVIGLIVLGVLVFCLCCYKVNHNQAFHLLNWLTWYPPVFWWLIRDICTKIRSHYIFKHIDTMIGSRGRGHRATASHYWLVISSSPHWHTLPPLISPGTHQYSVTIMQAPVPENPPQVQGQGLFGQGSIQIMLTNESESILWNL